MSKDEKQIKEITDNDLDTGRDLVTENYELEILTLKDKVDLRRFSRSFLRIDKLLKNAFTGIASHIATKVSQIRDGHMSKEDKIKLDNIADNANNYIHPTTSGNKHIPAGGGSNYFIKWLSDGTGIWDIIDWSFIQNKPSSYPPSSHTHDDRYFTEGEISEKFKNFCPIVIGALIFLDSTANPHTLYPGTTWNKIENRFLYAASTPGMIGGRSSISLVLANLPAHNHPATQGAHNHDANHNHSASQSPHAHTKPAHTHSISRPRRFGSSGVNTDSGWASDTASTTAVAYESSYAGGDNTGTAQPTVTVNTTNVITSNATPSITIGSVGSGTAFDIMPPYYTVCVWKRLS